MFDRWEIGVGALVCAIFVGMGAAIRSGHFRRGVRNTYFNRSLPDYQRNAIFGLLPGGLGFLLIIVAATMREGPDGSVDPNAANPLATLLFVVGVILAGTFFWWMFRLPEWAKPNWLREYERAERAGEPVPDLSPRPMSQRAYVLNWIGLFALAGLWLAVHLPVGPLLIGLGFGLTALLASRPRRHT